MSRAAIQPHLNGWDNGKRYLVFAVSVFFVIRVALSFSTYQDHCQLKATREGLLAVCVDRGLTKVPRGFPSDLTSLSLNSNNISILRNQSFVGLISLKIFHWRKI